MFQVNTPKLTRDLLVPAPEEAFIPFTDKVLAMYDYRKLPEKKILPSDRLDNFGSKISKMKRNGQSKLLR